METLDEIHEAIAAEWRSKSIKTNWPELEDIIRAIYQLHSDHKFDNNQALYYIAQATAAVTKRGEPPFEPR